MNLPQHLNTTVTRDWHNIHRVGVAVSGGADSVALLLALAELNYQLVVLHLDHGLRGEASAEDAAFVTDLAARLGFDIVSEQVDAAAHAAAEKISIEMAARDLRRAFYYRTMDAHKLDGVATGHHQNDQAETVLLRLARGAGLRGMGGMRPLSRDRKLLRPLLDIPRATIIEFLSERGQSWREDASNASDQFLRNRVRNHLLPLMAEQLNDRVVEHLSDWAARARIDESYLADVAAGVLAKSTQGDGLSMAGLQNEHPAIVSRVLLGWLEQWDCRPGHEGLAQLMQWIEAGETAGSAELDLPGLVVYREYDKFRVVVGDAAGEFSYTLANPGTTAMPALGLHVQIDYCSRPFLKPRQGSFRQYPVLGRLRASRLRNAELEIRSWREGDRMRPFGMEGSRKLQDIFTDLKVPRHLRGEIPVLVCGDEIVWLPGFRVSQGWEVEESATEMAEILLNA